MHELDLFEQKQNKGKKEYLSNILNNSENRLRNYSSLMEIINHSLTDIKNILTEENFKNEGKRRHTDNSETEIDTYGLYSSNKYFDTSNELSKSNEKIYKRNHKNFKSCDYDELEKIKIELGICDVKINSRNKNKNSIFEKLNMTTIDENEEKNNDSCDHSDCSSVQENVVILKPKGARIFDNLFSDKSEKLEKCHAKRREIDENNKIRRNKTNKTDKTDKTTVENEFLQISTNKDQICTDNPVKILRK